MPVVTKNNNKENEEASNGNPKAKADTDPSSKPKAATMRTKPADSLNVKDRPLVDFHIFAKLPKEMQDEVWANACHFAVTIQIVVGKKTVETVGSIPFKIPGVLQATSGSRGVALKHFRTIETLNFKREAAQTQVGHGPMIATTGIITTLFGGFIHGGYGPSNTTGSIMVNGVAQGANMNYNPANGANGVAAAVPFNGANGLLRSNRNIGSLDGNVVAAPEKPVVRVVLSGAFPVLSCYIVGYIPPPAVVDPLPGATPRTPPSVATPRKFYINMAATSFK